MNQNQVVQLVENSEITIFSKDDVLKLISLISDAQVESVKEGKFIVTDKFKDYLKNGIEQAVYDLRDSDSVDQSSFEFELCGNEISVNDFSLDKDYIDNEIWDSVSAYLDAYEETEEQEIEESETEVEETETEW
jgi:hypothetical protein